MNNSNYLYNAYFRKVLIFFGLLLVSIFTSCTQTDFTPDFVNQPVGNKIDITLIDKSEYTDVELLFINEDTLYTLDGSKINKFHLQGVKDIKVNGYSDRSWIYGVIGLQVVPSIALGIAATTVEGNSNGLILSLVLLIPAGIEIALFESSTPEAPVYRAPLDNKTATIKKYARYPIEMTREQISGIEKYYDLISRKKEAKKN